MCSIYGDDMCKLDEMGRECILYEDGGSGGGDDEDDDDYDNGYAPIVL